jgi:hypothetical protein
MKRLVPKGRVAKVQFFASRVPGWLERAAEIGVDPAQLAELAGLVAEAEQAYSAQRAAERAKIGAPLRFNELVAKVDRVGSKVIGQARGRARSLGSGASVASGIPPRAKRAPLGPPGKPFAFEVRLNSDGSLTLAWKCKHPRGMVGAMYHVSRWVGSSGKGKHLADVGEKKFNDVTIPRGAANITYEVRAFRSTGQGEPAYFNVSLGGGIDATMHTPRRRLVGVAPPSAKAA